MEMEMERAEVKSARGMRDGKNGEGGRERDMEGVKMRGRDRGRERGWRGRGGKRQRGADNEFRQKRSQDI